MCMHVDRAWPAAPVAAKGRREARPAGRCTRGRVRGPWLRPGGRRAWTADGAAFCWGASPRQSPAAPPTCPRAGPVFLDDAHSMACNEEEKKTLKRRRRGSMPARLERRCISPASLAAHLPGMRREPAPWSSSSGTRCSVIRVLCCCRPSPPGGHTKYEALGRRVGSASLGAKVRPSLDLAPSPQSACRASRPLLAVEALAATPAHCQNHQASLLSSRHT